MNWSRAKTMLILLLAAVNVYLAFNIFVQTRESRERESIMALEACDLLEERGFEIDREGIVSMPDRMESFVFERDDEAERQAAELLLGEAGQLSPGGGIKTFSSEKGSITFRSGGYVEVFLDNIPAEQLEEFLMPRTSENGYLTVDKKEYGLSLNGIPVRGAEIQKIPAGYVGTWIFSSVCQPDGASASKASLILSMGSLLENAGISSADRVECIYLLTAQQNGDIRLIPVWQLVCGNQTLYMNALSGTQLS